ncbi:ferrochelatase [Motilimonas eburnea]|uniref:ferrochelatase n=1 Tax=Motilimonas eburnea TaxID=1737488 RepID=UPI001E493AD0|nr:ferrochelatase [Motilimonas eburnea]MCE2573044.1 ferrochelatase [Motilimonas eburnea]
MSRFTALTENAHEKLSASTGVLLTNLGTPKAPTAAALRPYLKQFLSDPRVVEIPRLVWMIILHGIILRVRPAKSAKLYQSIWMEGGSPLLVHSQNQRDKLQQQLDAQGLNVKVKLAMRYGEPDLAKVMREFQQEGIRKVVVLPLYPQYSGPTTGSTFDAVSRELNQWRFVPQLHFINSYHDDPNYITALANSIREDIAANGMPDKLILSYHGMPKQFFDNGDPYYCLCMKTSRLVVEQLGLDKDQVITCFQSRFGKAEWLKPYTDATLTGLAEQGIKNVAVACPAFSADCLETLEEMVHENRDVFIEAGGEQYRYIAALNDRDDHIEMMTKLVKPYL